MPTSITFSGNNTNYTGTLYLHPLIDTIIFTNQDAIINNINFPKSESESRKINLIFKSNDNNIDVNELTIGNNLTLNLIGNLNINKLNLSNKSLLKLVNSNINMIEQSTDLQSINITSEEYTQIEYEEQTFFFIPENNIIAAWCNYYEDKNWRLRYYYPKHITYTNTTTDNDNNENECGRLIPLKTIKPTNELLSNEEIVNNYLTSNTCTCGATITKDNVNPTLVSYLFPSNISHRKFTFLCPICLIRSYKYQEISPGLNWSNNMYYFGSAYFDDSAQNIEHSTSHCQITNLDNIICDVDYLNEQVNKYCKYNNWG